MTPTSQTTPPDPESLLPLRALDVLVLTMLVGGARHGYGIRQDILDHSRGRIELEAGSTYRHIRRLEDDGLVAAAAAQHPADDDPRRIYYNLTPFGRKVLAAEMRRLRELVRLAESQRVISPARA
ncbi:MAG: PadR family transcriptional regulator [Gemmatimonadales bacterium]